MIIILASYNYCYYPKNCQTLTEFDISPWRLTAIQSSLCDIIIGNFCCYFRHYPIGVLFDLYGSSASLPWNLTVHFQVMKVVHSHLVIITLNCFKDVECYLLESSLSSCGCTFEIDDKLCMASLLNHCLHFLNLLL